MICQQVQGVLLFLVSLSLASTSYSPDSSNRKSVFNLLESNVVDLDSMKSPHDVENLLQFFHQWTQDLHEETPKIEMQKLFKDIRKKKSLERFWMKKFQKS